MSVTKEQAREFVERWAAVREFQAEELRATPLSERLRQLNDLMICARDWPWTPQQLAWQSAEIDAVRARWARVRKVCGV
jgi:Ser/Thr protein kinase RdoA (MazF antagonist)